MKKYFLTGLATLLPLAVTIYVVFFFVNFLTRPFVDIVTHLLQKIPLGPLQFLNSETIIRTASQILILIALFLFTILLGILARWFLIKWILYLGDRLLHKIPIINKVYKTTKDIIEILFASDKKTFQQVVMVRFPYNDAYCLGLITREAPRTCSEISGEEMISVFLPTTPNPTTGYMIVSPKSELIYLEMKSEEAVKYIVSCGMVQPSRGNS